MALEDKDIGTILVEQSYLSEEELKTNLAEAEKQEVDLVSHLMSKGLLTQALYENALAEYYKLPFYDIQENPPNPELINKLPEDIAREYNAIIVKHEGGTITVATSDPSDETLEEAILLNIEQEDPLFPEAKEEEIQKRKTDDDEKKEKSKKSSSIFSKKKEEGKRETYAGKVVLLFTSKETIEAALRHYWKPLATRFQQIIESEKKVAPEILEEIFADAVNLRASDIHFEPREKIVIVRFRVDGVLHEAGRIPKLYYEGVVNRVKIEANMRTDEHYSAQDGAIRHKTDAGSMDVRVNIVPVVDGEKIVMRLLASYVRSLTLSDLGFTKEHQKILTDAANKPFGMLLTTGPTGSGKSTTLSTLIKMRNSPDINISTIEDPVEYKVAGVNHIQVNSETGLTFASGLRALVRQDPDVILVGEIRDGETADISVNAALTGHLLFSTLHANTAATAVPRLLEMGVEPFLLASTLEVVIGQRLVRRICPHCRYSYSVKPSEAHQFFKGADKFFTSKGSITLYKGKGCEACGGTGFRGRIGIYELLEVTPEIEELITQQKNSNEISNVARQQGMKVMFEDGFQKMLEGMTTIEELKRVAAPPDILFSSDGKKKK